MRLGRGRGRQDPGADAAGGTPGPRRLHRRRPHPGHHLQPQGSRGAAHPAVVARGLGGQAGTFHRTALGLLREHRSPRGRPAPQLLPDRRRLLADVATGDPRRTRALDGEIGWAKARLVPPDRYEARGPPAPAAQRHQPRAGGRDLRPLRGRATRAAAARLRRPDRGLRRHAWPATATFADAHPLAHPAPLRRRDAGRQPGPVPPAHRLALRRARSLRGRRPQPVRLRVQRRRPRRCSTACPRSCAAPRSSASTRTTAARRRWWRWLRPSCATAVAASGAAATRPGSTGPCPRWCAHATDSDEAAWAASRAKLSRPPGPALVEHRRADPHQRPAGRGPGRHGRGRRAQPGGGRRPRAGQRPAPRAGTGREPDGDDGDAGAVADRSGTAVVLTTFHRAKGLQWPTVLVLGLGAGPHADRVGPDDGRRSTRSAGCSTWR